MWKRFTDGACLGNPGPGGWAALLKAKGTERLLAGGEAHTTNNRMELLAAISALEAITRSCRVELTTDSPLRHSRHRRMGAALERQRMAHRRQKASQEPGFMGTPVHRRGTPYRQLEMGARAYRAH